tara:strand:- start:1441 stop:1746 length:306 start_codon:yes stop_codon:yes gene_type:complete
MWYRLDENNKPIACESVLEYHAWEERNEIRRIVKQENIGDIKISTVFLGLDHAYDGEPLLWETMVFGGEHDQFQERYSSYEDAVIGHKETVALVKVSIELS